MLIISVSVEQFRVNERKKIEYKNKKYIRVGMAN